MRIRWIVSLSVAVLVALGLGNAGETRTAHAADDLNRAVLYIQGINSSASGPTGSCDAFESGGFWSTRQNIETAVRSVTQNYEGFDDLLSSASILGFSYSGAWCDPVTHTMPLYEALDTCDGIRQYAQQLDDFLRLYPGTKFDIIGHSMGGVVSAYWATGGTEDEDFLSDDDATLSAMVHSIITIDSPLLGTPFGLSWPDSQCARPAGGCVGGAQSWRDLQRCDPEVVDTIAAQEGDSGPLRVTGRVPFVHANSTIAGALLPGFWRGYQYACGLFGVFDHSCILNDPTLLTRPLQSIVYEVFDDRSLVAASGNWERDRPDADDLVTRFQWSGGTASETDDESGAAYDFSFSGSELIVSYGGAREATVTIDGQSHTLSVANCQGSPSGHNGITLPCSTAISLPSGMHNAFLGVDSSCGIGCSAFFLDALDVRANAKQGSVQTDLAFAIDATSSMEDDIDAAKAAASSIVGAFLDSSSQGRVALITYRDFPSDPYGETGDVPYRDVIDFSSDKAAVIAAIEGISVDGGGDIPEAVFCALIHAIAADQCDGRGVGGGLSWRATPNKFIILMGDAPPHDPEPFTGFVLGDVLRAAEDADPVTFHIVNVGSDVPELESLASGSGGSVFSAADASGVVDATLAAIGSVLSTPIANAGGQYVGQIGQSIVFDASASVDTDGRIVQFEWDWNNDGVYDEASAYGALAHTFDVALPGQVRLRVTDDSGLTAVDTASVVEGDPLPTAPPLLTSTSQGQPAVVVGVTLIGALAIAAFFFILQPTDSPWALELADGRRFALRRGLNLVGRDPGSRVVLTEATVSRRHAEIVVEEQAIRLRNLSTTNDTSLNDQRVSGANLRNGDKLTFGTTDATLRRRRDER